MYRIILLADRLIGNRHHVEGEVLTLEDGIARRLVDEGYARFVPISQPGETTTLKVSPEKAARTGKAE